MSDAFAISSTPLKTRHAPCSVKTRISCQDQIQGQGGDGRYHVVETRRSMVKRALMSCHWLTTCAALFSQPPLLPTATATAAEVAATSTHDDDDTPSAVISYYHAAKDVPESIIENHEWIYGYVEKVMDGDTIRIRHVPNVETFVPDSSMKKKMSLANTTIVVRVYGIDAPETAKQPNESSQPFGEEAKQFTRDLVYHRLVAVKPLRRDKYHRIVGEVETCAAAAVAASPESCQDVSVELVSKGLATLYTGAGAEYDGKQDLLKKSLQAAKRSKLGIWSLADNEFISPQEYKRQKKQSGEP